MSVLDDLLATIERDAAPRRWELGPRCAGVWSVGGGVGLASVPVRHAGPPRRETAAREPTPALARSADPDEAALGVASLNALLRPPEQLEPGNAYHVILELGAGRDVTVVGHFPFVERLRAEVRRLSVLELEPREGDLPASEAPRVIPGSDVVAITGSALVNHTLDRLLALARGGEVMLLGPSTPLSPVLFDHGVSVLAGAVVERPDSVLDQVRDGVAFRHMTGARQVIWRRAGGRV